MILGILLFVFALVVSSYFELMLWILFLVFALVVGYFEGLAKASLPVVHATALAILLISNGIAALPYYTTDSGTWIITYFTGLILTGSAYIVFYVVPFYLVYFIARKYGPRKRSSKRKRQFNH